MGTEHEAQLEREAIDLFRNFVRDNAALLRRVAHFGDGHCGELHRILCEELGVDWPPR